MAKIPPPTVHAHKPLSFEAQASLSADAQFLRQITSAAPEACELVQRPHFWHCAFCALVRKAKPACVLGRSHAA